MKWMITLIGLLPASPAKNWALSLLPGVNIHRSASLGAVLLVGVDLIQVGADVRIANFNLFRRLASLEVADRAEIGSFNWFSSAPFLVSASSDSRAGTLEIGVSASLTSRHYVDASGGVRIGKFATLAGVRSTVMSHGIDVETNQMTTGPIDVGDYSMVGGNAKIVLGASVPARSIVAMGSTVIPGLRLEASLYAGCPAVLKKPVSGPYFNRLAGPVPARTSSPGS